METLTLREAAQALKLCRTSVYRRVKDGSIPTIRIGRLLRVPKIALERLLETAFGGQPVEGEAE